MVKLETADGDDVVVDEWVMEVALASVDLEEDDEHVLMKAVKVEVGVVKDVLDEVEVIRWNMKNEYQLIPQG